MRTKFTEERVKNLVKKFRTSLEGLLFEQLSDVEMNYICTKLENIILYEINNHDKKIENSKKEAARLIEADKKLCSSCKMFLPHYDFQFKKDIYCKVCIKEKYELSQKNF